MLIQTSQSFLKKPSIPVEIVEQCLDQHPEKRAEVLTGKVLNKAFLGTLDIEAARESRKRNIEKQKRINEELVRIARREKRK